MLPDGDHAGLAVVTAPIRNLDDRAGEDPRSTHEVHAVLSQVREALGRIPLESRSHRTLPVYVQKVNT